MTRLATLRVAAAFGLSAAAAAAAAPAEFRVTTADGRTIESIDLRGKVVVLTWWAVWCAPCKKELADFDAYYRRRHADGLEIIALDADMHDADYRFRPPSDMTAFPFAVKLDGKGFPLEGVPTTYVINRRGQVVVKHHGSLSKNAMHALLNRLLLQRGPSA